ncbi:MAG: tetratricopeptide repeat protein [bacterium]
MKRLPGGMTGLALVGLLAGLALRLGATAALAESGAAGGKGREFAAYLSQSNLPALHLREIERLCVEGGDPAACDQYARALEARGEFGRVVEFGDALLARRAELNVGAAVIKARGLFGVGRYGDAVALLDSVVGAFPPRENLIEAGVVRAGCLYALGETDEALLNLRSLEPAAKGSLRAELLPWLAKCEEAGGDAGKACKIYAEAWKAGSGEAALGLVRCALRDGKPDACLAIAKEAGKRGVVLPSDGALDVAAACGETEPAVWRAMVSSALADTGLVIGAHSGALRSLVGAAEAGEDVGAICDALLRRGEKAAAPALRYARALAIKDAGRAADSLAVLVAEVSEPGLRLRCLASALALAPDRGRSLVSDLGSAIRQMLAQCAPDDRLALLGVLTDCGAGDVALGDLPGLASGLRPGYDDQALESVASLMERAGDRDGALKIYDAVAASQAASTTALACERQAYLLRNLTKPDVDIAREIEKIAKKDASDLELGDFFMTKLRDYGRAADYYARVLDARPKNVGLDAVTLKLVRARALAGYQRPEAGAGGEAADAAPKEDSAAAAPDAAHADPLALVEQIASAKDTSPEAVVEAVKLATDWLATDRSRAAAVLDTLARRDDLDAASAYACARLAFGLFLAGGQSYFGACSDLLSRAATDFPKSKQALPAALDLARLKLLAGDYAGAREAYATCAGKTRDAAVVGLCNAGIGECCFNMGGMASAVDYLRRCVSPRTSYLLGCAYEALGQADSSIVYYGASLAGPSSAAMADRSRLRLAIALGRTEGGASALAALDSPLAEVRARLADSRRAVGAYSLGLAGYSKIGLASLERLARNGSKTACQASLLAAELTGENAPELALAGLAPATADPDDLFEQYLVARARARYACSSPGLPACGEAGQVLADRFPMDVETRSELDLRQVLALVAGAVTDSSEAEVDRLMRSAGAHPLLEDALYARGLQLLGRADYPGAVAAFGRMISGFPMGDLARDACFKLGTAHYMQQRLDSAAVYFGLAALSDKPSLARDALFNQGLALEELGGFSLAAEAYLRLATRFPLSDQFERALVRCGYCLQSDGRPAAAVATYRAVLRYADKVETQAEAGYWIGEAMSQAGDQLGAACEFLRTAFLYPGQTEWAGTAAFMAGAECEKAGLTDHAVAIYKQNVRKFGKGGEWGKASDQRLRDLSGASPARGPKTAGE